MPIDVRKLCEQDDRFMVFMQDAALELVLELGSFRPLALQAYGAYQSGLSVEQFTKMLVMAERIIGKS